MPRKTMTTYLATKRRKLPFDRVASEYLADLRLRNLSALTINMYELSQSRVEILPSQYEAVLRCAPMDVAHGQRFPGQRGANLLRLLVEQSAAHLQVGPQPVPRLLAKPGAFVVGQRGRILSRAAAGNGVFDSTRHAGKV